MIKNTIKQAYKFSWLQLKPKIYICPAAVGQQWTDQREKPVVNPETWSHEKKVPVGLVPWLPSLTDVSTEDPGALSFMDSSLATTLEYSQHGWVPHSHLNHSQLCTDYCHHLSGLSTSSHASFPVSLHKALLHVFLEMATFSLRCFGGSLYSQDEAQLLWPVL